MLRKHTVMIAALLMILLAACSPQINTATTTPNFAATDQAASAEAAVGATQQAVADDMQVLDAEREELQSAQDALETERAELDARAAEQEQTQAELDTQAAEQEQTQAEIAALQADVAATQTALDADVQALAEQQAAVDAAIATLTAQPPATAAPPSDTDTSTEPAADPSDILQATFTLPPGWIAEVKQDIGGYIVSAGPEGRAPSERPYIVLSRDLVAEDVTDPLAFATDYTEWVHNTSNSIDETPGKPGRIRGSEVQIGLYDGATVSLNRDDFDMRLYVLDVGGDWLLIQLFTPPGELNAVVRETMRDFLASLEPVLDEGVLGLQFNVPEGWALATGDTTATLAPETDNPDNRQIALLRGTAADMPGFPEGETDTAAALQAMAEALLPQGDYGSRVRVEPLQIGAFSGAFVSLRGEEAATRLYLFHAGTDDWLLVTASATRDAFNDFNRAELRDFFASLEPAAGQSVQSVEPIGPVVETVVTHVSDGDTIYVSLNGVDESVRIIGIDTPEAHHPDSGADWMGYEATHYIERYVPVGTTVYLESDIRDRDDFDRLLRYVWIKDEDGNWINVEAELILAGMAHVRTYDEDRYVPYFQSLEREAQAAGRGIWGEPPPPPPVDSLAQTNDVVWAANPDGDAMPMLYDAAALGNVPDPYAFWPNNVPAVVRDVYYVYPTDIDPVTGQPVSEDKTGYWYWLEINDFRGWVPESWLLLEEPADAVPAPDTDIIGYARPFVVSDEPVDVLSVPGTGDVVGTFEPESRVQVERLGYDPDSETWWLFADTPTIDGWVPLANLNRLSPENR